MLNDLDSKPNGILISVVAEALIERGVLVRTDGKDIVLNFEKGVLSSHDIELIKEIKPRLIRQVKAMSGLKTKMSFADSEELLLRLLASDIARGIDEGRSVEDLYGMARILKDRIEDAYLRDLRDDEST